MKIWFNMRHQHIIRRLSVIILVLSGLFLAVEWRHHKALHAGAKFKLTAPSNGITLAWNASIDPSVTSYNIYWGGQSGVYTNHVNVGAATNYTVSGLTVGVVYYFSCSCQTSNGVQSLLSQEVSYAISGATLTIAPGFAVTGTFTNTYWLGTNSSGVRVHTNCSTCVQYTVVSHTYALTNYALSVPVWSNFMVQATTNLGHPAWVNIVTGSGPTTVNIPINSNSPPVSFFRFSH